MATNTLATAGLFVAPDGPPYLEITRQGGHWNTISAAVAPLVAVPTTVAALELWNNSVSGMTMAVTDLWAFHLLGTTVLHNLSIWAQVTAPKAVPTLTASAIASQSGKAPYTSAVGSRVVVGQGTTVIANGWRPWGTQFGVVSTALPGEAWSVPVDGKLIVPPGCSLCVHMVDAVATASSTQVGASWVEILTPPFVNVA